MGAGLTQISLLSALGRDPVRSLDEMAWAVRPENDNLASLAEYLGCASRDLYEGSSVRCWFKGLAATEMKAQLRADAFVAD